MVRVDEELPFVLLLLLPLLLLLLVVDQTSTLSSTTDRPTGVGHPGLVAAVPVEEGVPGGRGLSHPPPPVLAPPLGLHDAPGTTPAAAEDRGKPGRERNQETHQKVTQNNVFDVLPEGVATPRYSRRRRRARELVTPFEPLPGHLGDLGGERPHDQGLGKGLEDLLPLPYSSRWSRPDEARGWEEWGQVPHRRHRLRHGKRRREKEENRELLLLDTDLRISRVLHKIQDRRTLQGGHGADTAGLTPRLPPFQVLEEPDTTEDAALLLQPYPSSSKFRSGVADRREKQGEEDSPAPDPRTTRDTPASHPQRPRTLPPPGTHPSGSQGTAATQGLYSFLTPTTDQRKDIKDSTLDVGGTLRILNDQKVDRRTSVSSSRVHGGEVMPSGETTSLNHLPLTQGHDHPTTPVAVLPGSSSGNAGPNVTQKLQDPSRDPTRDPPESYKRQAIILDSGRILTPRLNSQTTYITSQSTTVPERAATTTNHHIGEDDDNTSSTSSLLHPTSVSPRETVAQDTDKTQEERTPITATPRSGERLTSDADRAGVEEAITDTSSPEVIKAGSAAGDSDLRDEGSGEPGGRGPPAEALVETEVGDREVEPSTEPSEGDDNPQPEDMSGDQSLLKKSLGGAVVVVPPSSAPARERNLRRPQTTPALVAVPYPTASSSSSCYSTYDLVVVVLLTSLANLVIFVLVTVMLCWCSLRGRVPPPQPRPLHLHDHNNDDLDDDAEETVVPEGCLEACLPDISYQRHIARGTTLRPSFVVGRALRPLVSPHPPRISHAVHELLHNLTATSEERQGRQDGQKEVVKKAAGFLHRRSLSLENLTLT